MLTVQELADLLQIPTKTIYTWRYKGIGPPAVPMGKYLRFRAEDVAAWLDARADVPRGGPRKRSQLGSRVAGGAR
jgi:excisionase family DNA binding protein